MGIEHSQDENDADNDQVSILSSRGAVLVVSTIIIVILRELWVQRPDPDKCDTGRICTKLLFNV